MIIWIDKTTKQFFAMDEKPRGVDLDNYSYKEISPEEYQRLEKLKATSTVIYDDGEFKPVEFREEMSREQLIQNLKTELNALKNKKIEKGVEIMDGVYHPARDTDKINLSLVGQTIGDSTRKWKCFDKNGDPVIIDINRQIINEIIAKGIDLLDGLIIGEAYAIKALNALSDEELQRVDVEAVYNKAIEEYKNASRQ